MALPFRNHKKQLTRRNDKSCESYFNQFTTVSYTLHTHTHTLCTHMQLWTLEIGSRRVNSRDGPPLSHTDAIINGSSPCGCMRECRPLRPRTHSHTPTHSAFSALRSAQLARRIKKLISGPIKAAALS